MANDIDKVLKDNVYSKVKGISMDQQVSRKDLYNMTRKKSEQSKLADERKFERRVKECIGKTKEEIEEEKHAEMLISPYLKLARDA